jgi:hypothetical protein
LIWLAPPSPALTQWLDRGGTALVADHAGAEGEPLWRDAAGNVLARSVDSGRGRVIALPGALTPEQLPMLLDADFPDRLRAAFAGELPAPTRAPAVAIRPRTDSAIGPMPAARAPAARPLDAWLALLIAGLFLFERIVATRARAESDQKTAAEGGAPSFLARKAGVGGTIDATDGGLRESLREEPPA